MTSGELLIEARNSPADMIRVAQEAWNGSEGRGNAVFRGLSEMPQAVENVEVRRFALRFIEVNGLGGPNIETLSNFLNTSSKKEETGILRAIASKYRDSIAPALIMTSRATPDELVDSLAEETGLAGQVLAPKMETRRRTLRMLNTVLTNLGTWTNERSAIFISDPFLKGELGDTNEILSSLSVTPSTFLYALAVNGTQEQRDIAYVSVNPANMQKIIELQLEGSWPMDPSKNRYDLLKEFIESPKTSPEDKIKMFDKAFYAQDNSFKDDLAALFSSLQSSETFDKALDLWEKGEIDTVEEITGNLFLACSDFYRIAEILKERNQFHRANPQFVSFVQNRMPGLL